MRAPFRNLFALVAVPLVLALAGNNARAADEYWTNDFSGGNFTNTDSWMSGNVPGVADYAYFTNNATPSSMYTVTFTTAQTNNALRIVNDSVRFDLNGYYWWTTNRTLGNWISNSSPQKVVFSSSSPAALTGGNTADFGAGTAFNTGGNSAQIDSMYGPVDVVVDDSLGYGVKLRWGGRTGFYQSPSSLTVSGTNTVFEYGSGNSAGFDTMMVVSNAALVLYRTNHGQVTLAGTTTVSGATFQQGADWLQLGISNTDRARMYISNGGTLIVPSTGTGIRVGPAGTGGAELRLDNSTGIVSNYVILGSGSTSSGQGGRLYVENGSTLYSRLGIWGSGTRSNLIVLNNGTITLGSGATAGVITNRDVMRAAGTIRGLGNSPALLYTGPAGSTTPNQLHVGNSIGTLTLSNVNLQLDVGSETFWELGDTGNDQIIMQSGSASVLGTNLFSLAAGSAEPTPGVKWGLGVYEFIVGTNITWNPQYDNLTNFLGGYGLVQGLDYNYGLVDFGSYQALRLEFVPEPSTVLLLVGGGLLLWRARRRM